ncbi:glycosyltransferase family 4 protein [bacterium]|nr:glycosyltransferase family 4 protein [bacterium]
MKILLLAPQPFYQERGTPIAVRLAAEVIAARAGDSVTLMTYEEGQDVPIPQVRHRRVRSWPRVGSIPPGFSLKKVYTDIFFFIAVLHEIWSHRGTGQYQVIHAVEESVFMALIVKWCTGIPFIYDMDSSLSLQLIEKFSWLSFLLPFFQWLEGLAIRGSLAVVPVCDALAVLAEDGGAQRTLILRDISLLNYGGNSPEEDSSAPPDLRSEAGIAPSSTVILYVGNLERYQGIDLLVESFHTIEEHFPETFLLIIGGSEEHIAHYTAKGSALGIPEGRLQLLGPRPVSHLRSYLLQADILTSPRILGNNTPMKVYSYLHSGVPLLATELPTHTQVLTPEVAELAAPTKEAFGEAMARLVRSPERRTALSQAAQALAEERYTFEVFEQRLNSLYDGVDSTLTLHKNLFVEPQE